MIRNQVIENRLRRKLLELPNVILQRLCEMAVSLKNSERQARTINSQESAVESVNRVRPKLKFRNYSAMSKTTEGTCWACGSSKNYQKDPSCPA